MREKQSFTAESKPQAHQRSRRLLVATSILFVSLTIPNQVKAQVVTNLSGGTSQRTQVSLSNTMGVYTNLDTSPNVKTEINASLNIQPGSTIQDSFGSGEQGSLSGAIMVTPTSSNIDLQGLSTKNNYIVGPGTSFSSKMETLHGSDCTGRCAAYSGQTRGSSGVGMSHNMSLTIDQSTTSFTNSFSQSF